jgi:hypothetical protein
MSAPTVKFSPAPTPLAKLVCPTGSFLSRTPELNLVANWRRGSHVRSRALQCPTIGPASLALGNNSRTLIDRCSEPERVSADAEGRNNYRPRPCLVVRMTAEQRAAADDSYCRSIGARPGTPIYVECRLRRDEQLQARIRASQLAAAAARPRNCVSFGNSVQCF